jgi:hypothetical protein
VALGWVGDAVAAECHGRQQLLYLGCACGIEMAKALNLQNRRKAGHGKVTLIPVKRWNLHNTSFAPHCYESYCPLVCIMTGTQATHNNGCGLHPTVWEVHYTTGCCLQ